MAEEDMLYGKARHLFGGIEPSNMKAFSVVQEGNAKPKITATLPDDTVIDGQTLCTVAGAMIRRKSTDYPKDEFDGEKVADIKVSGTFIDETAEANGTYYYAAYPYTTQGVYNRNPVNRVVFNEPAPMAAFTARLVYDSASQSSHVELTATLPAGAAGAIIRRSKISYPVNENDGDEFQHITASGKITDTAVEEGTTYYYSAFPYTSTGAYNRDTSNRISCTVLAGEAPDDMKAFSVVCDAIGQVKIMATLPDHKVEDDVEVCHVEGAYIVRKTGSYPINESDGVLITDLKQSGTYTDINLIGDTIYYYAAFPYSDRGMVNRDAVAANQASCKCFGAVAPGNMKAFQAVGAAGKITITATLPDNTVDNGITTCNVAGVIIRRSTTGYPTSETDGTQVADLSENGTVTDTDIVGGQMYYYAAFPYSDKGLFNRNAVAANQASAEGKTYEYLYGYDLSITDGNPATRVTYPADVDNAGFTAAKMNFGSAFSYGGWPSTPGEKFMPRPCMLTCSGAVDHYLNPNDLTTKMNGTESRVADASFVGNAMMEWPKIFVKRWEDDDGYHFRCSDMKLDDDFECWSNYDRNNNEIDHFYTPIFFGSKDSSNRLRSISGQANSVSATADTEITYAKANGNDWYTEVLADRKLIDDLLTMMAKSTDLQTAYGAGRTASTNSAAIAPGTMNDKGMFWGSDNGTDGVKVFGMENYWGNLWRRTAGWIVDNGTQKVKLTRGTKDGSTAADYNVDGSGYLTVPGATPTGTSGGYISKWKTMPYGRITVEASGSATTFECDAMWFNVSRLTYASVGGNWNYDLLAGPFASSLGALSSYSSADIGAALSCKPLAA